MHTAWDVEPFAADCAYADSPFARDDDRLFVLRTELDAAFSHLDLGTPDEWNRKR